MSEKEIHHGGCSCGAVRYETHGNPTRVAVCHCRYYQTRTVSAFGMNVYFEDSQIQFISGELKDYSFVNNAKQQFHNRFCPNCGTTVFWSIEMRPGWTGIALGLLIRHLSGLKLMRLCRFSLARKLPSWMLPFQTLMKLLLTTPPFNPTAPGCPSKMSSL